MARLGPHLFEDIAPFPDHNVLLALTFNPDDCANPDQPFFSFKFLNFNRQRVRQLLVQAQQQLLPDQFPSQESFTAVSEHILIVEGS